MGWVFLALILTAIAVAVRYGRSSEHFVLAALLLSYVGTFVSFRLGDQDWLTVDWGVWLSDTLAFLILFTFAMRTNKWWPLPIAGLQILPVFTPLIALTGHNLISDGLGRAQGLWAYPQLLLLIGASLSHRLIETRRAY